MEHDGRIDSRRQRRTGSGRRRDVGYSLSGLLLIFAVGFPNLRQIPRRYLLAGSVLFVSYEICTSRCRWAMPPAASRPLRWEWSITCGPA